MKLFLKCCFQVIFKPS